MVDRRRLVPRTLHPRRGHELPLRPARRPDGERPRLEPHDAHGRAHRRHVRLRRARHGARPAVRQERRAARHDAQRPVRRRVPPAAGVHGRTMGVLPAARRRSRRGADGTGDRGPAHGYRQLVHPPPCCRVRLVQRRTCRVRVPDGPRLRHPHRADLMAFRMGRPRRRRDLHPRPARLGHRTPQARGLRAVARRRPSRHRADVGARAVAHRR